MNIHSVTIDGERVSVLHGDGQRMDLKAACAGACEADDMETLMDLVGRVQALAVQERALLELSYRTIKSLAICDAAITKAEKEEGQ